MSLPLVLEVPASGGPLERCRAVAERPYTLWLDSALLDSEIGRRSFLALDPFLVLRGRESRIEWIGPLGRRKATGDPLDALARRLSQLRQAGGGAVARGRGETLGFPGGVAGYFGYELGRRIERVPAAAVEHPILPEIDVGFYDLVVGWDHARERAWIVSTGLPEEGAERERRARERMEAAEAWLAGGPPPAESRTVRQCRVLRPLTEELHGASREGHSGGPIPPEHAVPGRAGLRSTFTREAYERVVRRAVEYILAGDIFEVNLSQRFHARVEMPAFELYERLRSRNAAPFAAYFRAGACTLASASPERFLLLDAEGRVETRPIKGTRPRGYTPGHDMSLGRSLLESDKDRSENLMIVDLLRNDLSRVCAPGSVRVPELFRRERYATVQHLVSIVRGRLEEGRDAPDLLRAAFPGGSVTGAPKIRAMEIIAELEPVTRGPYCGSVGYLGLDGGMDTSIAIRTFVLRGADAYFHAGGAVVADSDPGREYLETLDKAAGLMAALPEER